MILAVCIGVLGLFCLYLEFFLPGGILALLGAVILLGSAVFFGVQSSSAFFTLLYVVALIFVAIGVCFIALRNIRSSGIRNAFFLQKSQEGFTAEKIEEDLVEKEGVVTTELKPAGHVRVGDKTYQALSQGDFLSKGVLVEVVAMKGSHIIVKQKK